MTPFVVLTDAQRTDEWRLARVGRLTGSRVAEAFAMLKSGQEAAGRRNLRVQLVLERVTGQPQEDGYVSKDMQRGADIEAAASAAYEARTGNLAHSVGFLAHPTLMAGCSPDAEIGGFCGLLEVKCPKSATHLDYLRTRTIPGEYFKQILHGLWITQADWCDFVSYDPRFPPSLRLMITRVNRSEVDLKAYELLVRIFLSEVDKEHAEVADMASAGAVA